MYFLAINVVLAKKMVLDALKKDISDFYYEKPAGNDPIRLVQIYHLFTLTLYFLFGSFSILIIENIIKSSTKSSKLMPINSREFNTIIVPSHLLVRESPNSRPNFDPTQMRWARDAYFTRSNLQVFHPN